MKDEELIGKNVQGHKPTYPLRFSKSGKEEIEKAYATHYVDYVQIMALKEGQKHKNRCGRSVYNGDDGAF